MRTALIALAFCLWGHVTAAASPLQGQWRVASERLPAYVGIILIDADQRVTWDSPDDNGRPAKLHGFVAAVDSASVEVTFTDRIRVIRMRCSAQSADLLACQLAFPTGPRSDTFLLVRVGPGPSKLKPVLP